MTLYGKFLAACVIALSLAGCSADDGGKITEYRYDDAQFTLTFPSACGDVTCEGVKTSDNVTLTVTEPQRSSGITVKIAGNSCTVAADDCEIPLTAEASAGLTDVVNTLFAPLEEPITASKTADGEGTVITTPYGVLYLDEELLPCSAECQTWNGETRTVTVANYERMQ